MFREGVRRVRTNGESIFGRMARLAVPRSRRRAHGISSRLHWTRKRGDGDWRVVGKGMGGEGWRRRRLKRTVPAGELEHQVAHAVQLGAVDSQQLHLFRAPERCQKRLRAEEQRGMAALGDGSERRKRCTYFQRHAAVEGRVRHGEAVLGKKLCMTANAAGNEGYNAMITFRKAVFE